MEHQEIVKIGPVELTRAEAEKYYARNLYLVTYTKIWQIQYSQAQKRFYGLCVYRLAKKGEHFTQRGRFYAYDAENVNWLVGAPLLRT